MLNFTELEAETRQAGVSDFDRATIAQQVGFISEDESNMSELPQPRDLCGSLRRAVEAAVSDLNAGNPKLIDQRRMVRAYSESLMAWSIVADYSKRREAQHELEEVNERLLAFADGEEQLSPLMRDRCWQLDAEFHRTICRHSAYPHWTHAVDVIQEKCRDVGQPRSVSDVQQICREHGRILSSMFTENPSLVAVVDAINDHLKAAVLRWFGTEARMEIEIRKLADEAVDRARRVLSNQSTFFLAEQLSEAIRDAITEACNSEGRAIPLSSCDYLRASLTSQFLHPGEYVVYVDHEFEENGVNRCERSVLFHHQNWEYALTAFHREKIERGGERIEIELEPDPNAVDVG